MAPPRADTAPHGVETLNPTGSIPDRLRFVKPASPGENKVPSPDCKSLHISITKKTGDENGDPRVDSTPHGVETQLPLTTSLIG